LNFLEDTAKGAQHPPVLDPCLLWPRSPISATAELVSVVGHALQITLFSFGL